MNKEHLTGWLMSRPIVNAVIQQIEQTIVCIAARQSRAAELFARAEEAMNARRVEASLNCRRLAWQVVERANLAMKKLQGQQRILARAINFYLDLA